MSKAAFKKQALTYQQQLQQLIDRGLHVPDKESLLHLLEVKSYYRLSGYWYPLLADKERHIFKKGASFETAYKIYCFDRELRHFVLAELEKIEVAIRAKLIYIFSHCHGPFWYLDKELFKDERKHKLIIEKLEKEYERSDEEFILAFRKKYSEPMPPSWMLLEVTSFGTLSVMYYNLKSGHEKRRIAEAFGLSTRVFSSWIHCLVYLRNICAHHARLWNREMSIQPMIPHKTTFPWLNNKTINNKRFYFMLSILVYMMNRIKYENDVVERFKGLLAKYPNIDPAAMGFPRGWENEPFWNGK